MIPFFILFVAISQFCWNCNRKTAKLTREKHADTVNYVLRLDSHIQWGRVERSAYTSSRLLDDDQFERAYLFLFHFIHIYKTFSPLR